jgi:hypothetical protein
MIDTSNYEKIREDAQKLYNDFIDVLCPALNTSVSFSSHGFNHLIYRKGRSERDRTSQIMRFKLLVRAYELIALTTTFQEYEDSLKEFRIKRYKKKIETTKQVQYWGLIAIIDNRKIKVILRKIGDGNLHFWSVIPAWVTNKSRDGKFITTMKGNPEND